MISHRVRACAVRTLPFPEPSPPTRGYCAPPPETGGRFYTTETVKGLPEDLRYAGRGVTTVEERELWHMPIVLLALVGLMCGEWGYRRSVGLA